MVKIVAGDKNNSLVNYAVKNSSTVAEMIANSAGAKARSANVARGGKLNDELTKFDANAETEKLAIWEKAKEGAVYTLDDTVIMNFAKQGNARGELQRVIVRDCWEYDSAKAGRFYGGTIGGRQDFRVS